ncbi:hypothetical protein ANAPC2_01375 [Anaplasma phagocytophilum]|nr:hypothetical protein ANAPC2_01375 [Anaplasma phagocytophilum]
MKTIRINRKTFICNEHAMNERRLATASYERMGIYKFT